MSCLCENILLFWPNYSSNMTSLYTNLSKQFYITCIYVILITLSAAFRFLNSFSTRCFVSLQLDCTISTSHRCWHHYLIVSFSFKCFLSHFFKSNVDLRTLNCTGLKEHHVIVFFGPLFAHACLHCTLSFLI